MAHDVRARITGTVWKIQVKAGAEVRAGQPLIVLESMKMEIPIEAHVAGRIVSIEVVEGQAVEEDEVLLRIE